MARNGRAERDWSAIRHGAFIQIGREHRHKVAFFVMVAGFVMSLPRLARLAVTLSPLLGLALLGIEARKHNVPPIAVILVAVALAVFVGLLVVLARSEIGDSIRYWLTRNRVGLILVGLAVLAGVAAIVAFRTGTDV